MNSKRLSGYIMYVKENPDAADVLDGDGLGDDDTFRNIILWYMDEYDQLPGVAAWFLHPSDRMSLLQMCQRPSDVPLVVRRAAWTFMDHMTRPIQESWSEIFLLTMTDSERLKYEASVIRPCKRFEKLLGRQQSGRKGIQKWLDEVLRPAIEADEEKYTIDEDEDEDKNMP